MYLYTHLQAYIYVYTHIFRGCSVLLSLFRLSRLQCYALFPARMPETSQSDGGTGSCAEPKAGVWKQIVGAPKTTETEGSYVYIKGIYIYMYVEVDSDRYIHKDPTFLL